MWWARRPEADPCIVVSREVICCFDVCEGGAFGLHQISRLWRWRARGIAELVMRIIHKLIAHVELVEVAYITNRHRFCDFCVFGWSRAWFYGIFNRSELTSVEKRGAATWCGLRYILVCLILVKVELGIMCSRCLFYWPNVLSVDSIVWVYFYFSYSMVLLLLMQ